MVRQDGGKIDLIFLAKWETCLFPIFFTRQLDLQKFGAFCNLPPFGLCVRRLH